MLLLCFSHSDTPISLLSKFRSGLESDFHQQLQQISANEPSLKLGPAPKDPKLMREVSKILAQEEAPSKTTESGDLPEGENVDVTMADGTKSTSHPATIPTTPQIPEALPSNSDLIVPAPSDLLPYPNNFKTLDLRREVESIREAKKRIRLGPEAFKDKQIEKEVWRPSVCAFTIHDAGQTYGVNLSELFWFDSTPSPIKWLIPSPQNLTCHFFLATVG